ncbi:hypothetical protein MesoLj113b_57540 [Mesorhizobium sp. 113-3-3]|nr:hypothetical protein MesoLj113b_57540 [Mesorhizobium sp. 113-3-3]
MVRQCAIELAVRRLYRVSRTVQPGCIVPPRPSDKRDGRHTSPRDAKAYAQSATMGQYLTDRERAGQAPKTEYGMERRHHLPPHAALQCRGIDIHRNVERTKSGSRKEHDRRQRPDATDIWEGYQGGAKGDGSQ